jgi:hypothetical protein
VQRPDDFETKYRSWHTKLSYTKSAARIAACLGVLLDLPDGTLILACGLLLAELVGIMEEWV